MQVNDKFLKKINLIFLIILIFLSPGLAQSKDIKNKLIEHNNSLRNVSIIFLQTDGATLEEGFIYIGKERIRVDYSFPNKITIVLSEKKGMYVNHELEESQFFNVNKTFVKIYYKLFRDKNFFKKASIEIDNDKIIVKKKYLVENTTYPIEIIYENNPVKLKKIKIEQSEKEHTLSLVSYQYADEFRDGFFALIDPYL